MKINEKIIWPEPNGQQICSLMATVSRITPAAIDGNSKSPSFTLTALDAIRVCPNSLKATDGDVVIGSVLVPDDHSTQLYSIS